MSLFKKLFGSKPKQKEDIKPKKVYEEDKEFVLEFEDAFKRYNGQKGKDISVDLEFKDKEGEVIPISYAFEEFYEEWKTIHSIWDRRSVLFKAMDSFYYKNLSLGQKLDRYTYDRYPQRALELDPNVFKSDEVKKIDFMIGIARAFFFLSNYGASLRFSTRALQIDSENKDAKIILADTLHMTNEHEKAHEIYHEILEKSLKEWEEDDVNLFDILCYQNDILHSSVYAVGLLSDDEVSDEMWNKVAEEFYHCAYFRTRHAFKMIEKGQHFEGLGKIIVVTEEFPFYEEALINAKDIIHQFREQTDNPDFLEEKLEEIEEKLEQINQVNSEKKDDE
ncbi:tetratricopeptide repeat protein [Aureivirga marina]|uniref:tetratricopeptide repeat protein n=1 Tax=Aureivirga marina TaxID=1182451 RepID=UPI0018C8E11A|nr:hypothetical protein [Aureivirga marina]